VKSNSYNEYIEVLGIILIDLGTKRAMVPLKCQAVCSCLYQCLRCEEPPKCASTVTSAPPFTLTDHIFYPKSYARKVKLDGC